MWRNADPSFYYAKGGKEMVIALVSGSTVPDLPPPFIPHPPPSWTTIGQILAPIPLSVGDVPVLPPEVRRLVADGSALLLFPILPEDVGPVVRGWATSLEGERWWADTERQSHLLFVSSEVADNPNDFQSFLLPEWALWEALHRLHPSKTTEYARAVVKETIELGEVIQAQFFQPGRRPTSAATQALCDLVARTVVLEKLSDMQVLVGEVPSSPATSH